MEKVIRIFHSFAEAEAADRDYYQRFTSAERLDQLAEFLACFSDGLLPRLQAALRAILASGVDYVVTGQLAVVFYGRPRYLLNLDAVVEHAHDLVGIRGALRDAGATVTEPGPRDVALTATLCPLEISVSTEFAGVATNELIAQRVAAVFAGVPASFPTRKHLLEHKRTLGRLKDRVDIEEIEDYGQPESY